MAHRRLRDGALRRAALRPRGRSGTALAGALLCVALPALACGGDRAAVPSPRPSGDAGPACAAGTPRVKPVPDAARELVLEFVAALERGDRRAMRQALVPAVADEVLAALAPVERLTLLSLSDDY